MVCVCIPCSCKHEWKETKERNQGSRYSACASLLIVVATVDPWCSPSGTSPFQAIQYVLDMLMSNELLLVTRIRRCRHKQHLL